jgi:hypothetical protein
MDHGLQGVREAGELPLQERQVNLTPSHKN